MTRQTKRKGRGGEAAYTTRLLSEYFYITDVYACNITRVNEAMGTGNTNLLDFDEFSEEVINDMAEYINDAIETER